MRKYLWIGSVATMALAAQAHAQGAPEGGISYSYLEADYLSTDFDRDSFAGVKIDGDGFGIQGAVAFGDYMHGYVEHTNQDFDFDLSLKTWEVGVGGNWTVAPKVSVFGRLAYAKADADIVDDDGYALQGGVRALVGPGFELEGLIHYTDLDDFGDNTAFRVSGRYWFTPNLALNAGVELDSDVKTWMVGARYSFK